jgi:hypothetical protein
MMMIIMPTTSESKAEPGADDPFIGTWKLNPTKSKTSYPMEKSVSYKFEISDSGIKGIDDVVKADGQAIHRTYAARYDGKEYPVTAPDIDVIVMTKADANTMDYAGKKNGREVWRGRSVVSKDGKTMTDNGSGKDEKGQAFTYSYVLEKQ